MNKKQKKAIRQILATIIIDTAACNYHVQEQDTDMLRSYMTDIAAKRNRIVSILESCKPKEKKNTLKSLRDEFVEEAKGICFIDPDEEVNYSYVGKLLSFSESENKGHYSFFESEFLQFMTTNADMEDHDIAVNVYKRMDAIRNKYIKLSK